MGPGQGRAGSAGPASTELAEEEAEQGCGLVARGSWVLRAADRMGSGAVWMLEVFIQG